MALIKRENADDIVTLLIAILMFQALPRLPVIGQYFEKYPLAVLGIALILLIKRKAIINAISK